MSAPRRVSIAAVLSALALSVVACTATPETTEAPAPAAELATTPCSGAGSVVDLACPAPPDTFAASGLTGTDAGTAWDTWAWSSFAAYNWPALASTDGGTYPTGYVRGVPDTTRTFTGAASDDVLVWETFKEKRELFNSTAAADAWQQLTFDPTYAPDFNGGQVPACDGVSAQDLERAKRSRRVIAQTSKQSPSIDGDNAPDETAEVSSPAQEPQDTLCAGYTATTTPTLAECQADFPVPSGGDGSSPFPPDVENPRSAVGPRVFKGTPAAESFVYYEVKLNYDYYDYVASNGLNDYDTAVGVAAKGAINLPWRTSASSGGGPNPGLRGYVANDTAACYADKLAGCGSLPNQSGIGPNVLPRIGSVQLKSAWLPTSLLDGDADDYHTTYAVYYRDASTPSGLCYAVEQFGLIGLHIIQRVHGGTPSSGFEQIGGTFIFATWEHTSIGDGDGYTYVNFLADSGTEQDPPPPFPNTAAGIPVARQTFTGPSGTYSYPLPSTTAVTTTAWSQLPAGSVWRNYRLIGTQFQASDSASDSLALGQPYYLANLVIETNAGLQNFQGLPPHVTPIAKYAAGQGGHIITTSDAYEPTADNLTFAGTAYDMGGCMGCHAVAQDFGFSFSFVLQDGSKGTKPDTAGSVAIPPILPPTGD